MPPRVLFVCKRRPANYGASYGLLNSCRFLVNALRHLGAEAELVEVIDNNFIDREVTKYNPTHVFIEAFWVVPEKFHVLIKLHPQRQWHVRLHSNTPFLANEGVAMEWIAEYAHLQKKYSQFHISPNSARMCHDLQLSMHIPTIYSPNIYFPNEVLEPITPEPNHSKIFNVGCFGAIRPLKNHLIQAMAAISFAEELNHILHFHVNHSRLEQNGENVFKNLRALFKHTKHKLVEHDWMLHDEFMRVIQKMDMGLQVSFSETFNIVAADFASANVPVIGSKEIEWMSGLFKAEPTCIDSIIDHLWIAYAGKRFGLQRWNKWGLDSYNLEAMTVWKNYLKL